MGPRQTLPRTWLVSDERAPDLLATLDRLPAGTGVLFRHHATPPAQRRALFAAARAIARRRRLVLVLAGPSAQAIGWRAGGAHGRSPHRHAARRLLRTAPAHDARELIAAWRAGVDLVFLSPAYPTSSHPGARALGRCRLRLLARGARPAVVALGGMNAAHARTFGRAIHGWAGIDAWGAGA